MLKHPPPPLLPQAAQQPFSAQPGVVCGFCLEKGVETPSDIPLPGTPSPLNAVLLGQFCQLDMG